MSLVCSAVFVLAGTLSRRAGAARRTELLEKLGVPIEPISPRDEGPDPAHEGIPAEIG